MPRLVTTPQALQDLDRMRLFLQQKSPAASARAAQVIRHALDAMSTHPEGFRPVPDMAFHREAVIKFGASGYIARFFYQPGGEVVVLRIKHQREADF